VLRASPDVDIVSDPVASIAPPNPDAELGKIKTRLLLDDGDVEIVLATVVEPELKAALSMYIEKDTRLPIWQPQSGSDEIRSHISGLQIPKLSDSSPFPSLLMHGLGQPSHDTQPLERVNKLFRAGSRHKYVKTSLNNLQLISLMARFLCNTSGSGKTRLLLEGLTRNWGLYFTARTQSDGIGSSDLERILKDLESEGRLTMITEENRATALDANREVTARRFLLLIYVRLLVLRIFLRCASARPGGIKEEHRHQSLLLQVAPGLLPGPDVFLEQTQRFKKASFYYLQSSVKSELQEIRGLLGQSSELFCILDEAQVPTNMSLDCFRSETNEKQRRPLLRQIILSWKSWLPNLIISGTGVSMQDLEVVFGSAVAKEGGLAPETFTELGAFDNENAQRASSSTSHRML
jgi:hypothetical protein